MPGKATTYRIDSQVQAGLQNLSRLLKRPLNQLVNEAVRGYVRVRTRQLELELESVLAGLRAYRERDPDYDGAIEGAAGADTRLGGDDPAEGHAVYREIVSGHGVETPGEGPVQQEIRKLLDD